MIICNKTYKGWKKVYFSFSILQQDWQSLKESLLHFGKLESSAPLCPTLFIWKLFESNLNWRVWPAATEPQWIIHPLQCFYARQQVLHFLSAALSEGPSPPNPIRTLWSFLPSLLLRNTFHLHHHSGEHLDKGIEIREAPKNTKIM